MDPFGPIWTHMDQFRPICPIWTPLVAFGKVWNNLDPFDPILTYFYQFEKNCTTLEPFGALWTKLDPIGPN